MDDAEARAVKKKIILAEMIVMYFIYIHKHHTHTQTTPHHTTRHNTAQTYVNRYAMKESSMFLLPSID